MIGKMKINEINYLINESFKELIFFLIKEEKKIKGLYVEVLDVENIKIYLNDKYKGLLRVKIQGVYWYDKNSYSMEQFKKDFESVLRQEEEEYVL